MAVEVYPVVHITEEAQGVDQALIALGLGADGVYLIDHHSDDTRLLGCVFNSLSDQAPDAFIGLNILQVRSSLEAFQLIQRESEKGTLYRLPNGLWMDDASRTPHETKKLRDTHEGLEAVRYLGGVAFKYTNSYTGNPVEASQQAALLGPYVDIVVTTGSGTGHAATIDKVRAMKDAILPQHLALASGVNMGNVEQFAKVADQVLVATSVETVPSSGIFDQKMLEELITAAHQ